MISGSPSMNQKWPLSMMQMQACKYVTHHALQLDN